MMAIPLDAACLFEWASGLSAPTHAQSIDIKSRGIKIVLTGNTAFGKLKRQYIYADCSTVDAKKNAGLTVGKWRLDWELQK